MALLDAYYSDQSLYDGIQFESNTVTPEEELVQVKGYLTENQFIALFDSGFQRSYISVKLIKEFGITPDEWKSSTVEITYGNKETRESSALIFP